MKAARHFLLPALLAVAELETTTSMPPSNPTTTSTTAPSTTSSCSAQREEESDNKDDLAIIIDVDNTLYCEDDLKRLGGGSGGIEEQIVANTHRFCQEHLGLSPQQADELFQKYGTTIEGIRQEYPNRADKALLEAFYRQVYDPIDVKKALQTTIFRQKHRSRHMDDTGYSHAGDSDSLVSLRELLMSIPYSLYLASNSPSWHVKKVVAALGLSMVPWKGWFTPDLIEQDENDDNKLPYPTKAHPETYYRDLLASRRHSSSCILLDDSLHNVQTARNIGMRAIHINHDDGTTLEQGLAMAMGHVDSNFTSSDVRYLQTKNVVDGQSIHVPTWQQLANHLLVLLPKDDDCRDGGSILTIVDVGAGLLSMLQLILEGQGDDKRPLLSSIMDMKRISGMVYYAYEPNIALLDACRATLMRLGFALQEKSETEMIYHRPRHNVTVHLRMMDFTSDDRCQDIEPQLIVGCCFADLMDPHELVESLLRFSTKKDTLVYFPITFSGVTQFVPPQPFGRRRTPLSSSLRRAIPSDTTAFALYSDALAKHHGHNVDPETIVDAMSGYGATLLHRGPSNWRIDPTENEYLWKTMLYFFGTVGAPEMMKQGWDSVGWIDRAKHGRPSIEVSNIDLLFRLSDCQVDDAAAASMEAALRGNDEEELSIEEIQFAAPNQVGTRIRTIDTTDGAHLLPNQVEIRSICSLISSGTELKIFKGMFDDAALDVNIDGMAEERMAYPLSYGYSLVGKVTRCGSNVNCDELLGRLVFTFSPHSSHAVVDRQALQLVPDGIDALDAVFMPSMETALSIVHDAHVRIGETIAVFGQGLIGLLVTAILATQTNALPGTLTTFDGIPERLAMSSLLGSSQALLPEQVTAAGPFDVCIEVSGNSRALQSAIDNAKSGGGRIIVGSWYGNADIKLKLGIDFHRSHKTITTSQVSVIPAKLSTLWSKERRFELAWDLVRQIRPSRLVTRRTTLRYAQEAYDALDGGKEIAVVFDYP